MIFKWVFGSLLLRPSSFVPSLSPSLSLSLLFSFSLISFCRQSPSYDPNKFSTCILTTNKNSFFQLLLYAITPLPFFFRAHSFISVILSTNPQCLPHQIPLLLVLSTESRHVGAIDGAIHSRLWRRFPVHRPVLSGPSGGSRPPVTRRDIGRRRPGPPPTPHRVVVDTSLDDGAGRCRVLVSGRQRRRSAGGR